MNEQKRKYNEERVTKMYEIINSIDHWLALWSKGKINQKVGALIQRHAMRELVFIDYLDNNWLPMDELRIMANDELQRLGKFRVPKPIPVPAMIDLAPEKLFGWKTYSVPFPTLTIKKPTRREELEAMSDAEVHREYRKAKTKEQREQRIEYILEAGKKY
jgi:hypothetical protein